MNPAALRGAIERCGEPVRIVRDGEVFSFLACIQPRPHTNQLGTGEPVLHSRFGREDPRQFYYYGPPDGGGEQVQTGVIIETATARYLVVTCHEFWFRGEAVYRWASLKPADQEVEDGTVLIHQTGVR